MSEEKSQHPVGQIRHQHGDEFGMPAIFGAVPWKHHVCIFTESQSLDEALFYINKVASEGWSCLYLEHQIDEYLYQTQGSAITNFESAMPSPQSKLVLDRTVAELELKQKKEDEE